MRSLEMPERCHEKAPHAYKDFITCSLHTSSVVVVWMTSGPANGPTVAAGLRCISVSAADG